MKTIFVFLCLLMSWTSFAKRSPEERKALFVAEVKRIKLTGIEGKIPHKGDFFPDLTIGDKKVSKWLRSGPLVVTFYRGGWCPFCVKQLKELDSQISSLATMGAQLVAISPETAENVRKTKSKNDLHFTMLPDPSSELARKLKLVSKVSDEVVREMEGLGISLKDSQGNSNNELPVPATFVVGQDRKIAYAYANANYTERADVKDILSALKGLKKK